MNLTTPYLGLMLPTPFVVGASPFCDRVQFARRLQDAGAGAVVMRSLFEEQFETPGPVWTSAETPEEFSAHADYQFSPEQYLRQLAALKAALSIPVIASLNAHRPGGWAWFAPYLEQAGADAVELNCYRVVTDTRVAADQVETEMLETVGLVSGAVRIPVVVKLSPFHASVAQLAVALELAGAAGLVLFNRFYQPDVNIDELGVESTLQLSDSSELLLRLRWLAILSPQLRGSLAAGGGVHTAADAVKALLTGADTVQVVSVLARHGPSALTNLVAGLRAWMQEHDFTAPEQFRGRLDLSRCPDAAAYERANYLRLLRSARI